MVLSDFNWSSICSREDELTTHLSFRDGFFFGILLLFFLLGLILFTEEDDMHVQRSYAFLVSSPEKKREKEWRWLSGGDLHGQTRWRSGVAVQASMGQSRVLITFTKFEELQPSEEFSTPPTSPVSHDAKSSDSKASWVSWMKGTRGGVQSSDVDSNISELIRCLQQSSKFSIVL
ncbi:Ankyrin repeat domain-containing protein 13 protein [Raphanus sativus]|nr:Ankyrin repeat domain-containing protein 13 protein [Raphanus sativus]